MKKSKKFIGGIILLVVGVIGILGAGSINKNIFTYVLTCIILILLGVLLIFSDKKQKKESLNNSAINKVEKQVSVEEEDTKDYSLFASFWEDYGLAYTYEKNFIVENNTLLSGNGGKQLFFRLDDENQIIEVRLLSSEEKIGFLYNNNDNVRKMILDWYKRDWPLVVYLNRYSVSNSTATIKVGFYKPLSSFESRICSLTKISKRTEFPDIEDSRFDNLRWCSEGEAISIKEYDDTYIAYHDFYMEIGELPKSVSNYINDNEFRSILGKIETLDYDSLSRKASVTLHLYFL